MFLLASRCQRWPVDAVADQVRALQRNQPDNPGAGTGVEAVEGSGVYVDAEATPGLGFELDEYDRDVRQYQTLHSSSPKSIKMS